MEGNMAIGIRCRLGIISRRAFGWRVVVDVLNVTLPAPLEARPSNRLVSAGEWAAEKGARQSKGSR